MALNTNTTQSKARVSRYAGLIRFFLLVILVVLILLLGRAMVNHRFFRGGWVNSHDVLKP
jgi:hypothetical protein